VFLLESAGVFRVENPATAELSAATTADNLMLVLLLVIKTCGAVVVSRVRNTAGDRGMGLRLVNAFNEGTKNVTANKER
jgi:hypothetical protein